MEKLNRSNIVIGSKEPTTRIRPLNSEFEALSWISLLECMLELSTCRCFSTDFKDLVLMLMIQDSGSWPNFSTELKELMKLKNRHTKFLIVFISCSENISSNSLDKIARSFHKCFYYISCFTPI